MEDFPIAVALVSVVAKVSREGESIWVEVAELNIVMGDAVGVRAGSSEEGSA